MIPSARTFLRSRSGTSPAPGRRLRPADRRRTRCTPAGLAYVSTFSAGLEAGADGPVHALPVLHKGPAQESVLLRPACGAPAGPTLLPAGDWRELAAHEQCRSCDAAVAAVAA